MTLPEFENKFTIGNLLTILAMIVAGLWSYSQLQNAQERQADRIAVIEQTIREKTVMRDADSARKDARITSLEIAQASQSSDLRNIQVGINEIKISISQLSQKVSK